MDGDERDLLHHLDQIQATLRAAHRLSVEATDFLARLKLRAIQLDAAAIHLAAAANKKPLQPPT